MLILMMSLTFVGLNYMARVNVNMKNIVKNNNVKISLAQTMLHTLNGRALSMHAIAVLDDAFLQDEEYMYFRNLGTDFYTSRKKLDELITTDDEKKILLQIKVLTQQTQPGVEEVVDLGMNGNKSFVFEKIREHAIPNQRLIAKEVEKLVAFQEKQANKALNDAQLAYKDARSLMFILGGLAIVIGATIAVRVISRVSKQADQLERQALHDGLTALPNRMLFEDRLKKAIRRGQRQGMSFAVILLDLVQFKAVNDSLGHNVGDLLLQEVARRLKKKVRKMDTVARLGGDEFVILLESISYELAVQFVEKISATINEPFLLTGKEISVGVSMGIASYPDHGHDCMTLINRADIAMYEAKRKRLPYIYYSEKIKQSVNMNLSGV